MARRFPNRSFLSVVSSQSESGKTPNTSPFLGATNTHFDRKRQDGIKPPEQPIQTPQQESWEISSNITNSSNKQLGATGSFEPVMPKLPKKNPSDRYLDNNSQQYYSPQYSEQYYQEYYQEIVDNNYYAPQTIYENNPPVTPSQPTSKKTSNSQSRSQSSSRRSRSYSRSAKMEKPTNPPLQMPKVLTEKNNYSAPPSAPKQTVNKSKGVPRKRIVRGRPNPVIYVIRMIVLGVGLGAIAGTLLSIWDPATHQTADTSQPESPDNKIIEQPATTPAKLVNILQLSQEIAPLKTEIEKLSTQYPDLTPGILVLDVDTGDYLDINGNTPFSAASTIKIPILLAFFQDVDTGKIRLDELIKMKKEHIAEGSGNLQYKPVGSEYTALEIANKMITISDNTATNMLIEKLGGAEALNQRFREWGLNDTKIENPLPDLEGTNTTSPRDLANIMAILHQVKLISPHSRDRALAIMRKTVNNSLLPQGLGEGATIAHKTGDIGSILADAGMIDLPNGKRYIAAVIVKRPHNDDRAYDLIRDISKAAYKQLSQAATTAATATPSPYNTRGPNKTPNQPLDPPMSASQQARIKDR